MYLPPHTIVASGPVIIEHGKVLLNREQKADKESGWMFPGGEVEDFDVSLEETCCREVGEELDIDVKILKPLSPLMIRDNDRVIILIHYLAERIGDITPGKNIVEWGWHDITALPKNCAPNVYRIIDELKETL